MSFESFYTVNDILNYPTENAPLVSIIKLDNPNLMKYLDRFPNVEMLNVSSGNYSNESKDINLVLSKLLKLNFFSIEGCSIEQIDLSNASSLEKVFISNMNGLKRITGLEKLKSLKTFAQRNNSLQNHPDYLTLISKTNVNIEIDVHDVHLLEKQYPHFLEKIPTDDRITFFETIHSQQSACNKYHACQVKIMEKHANEILDRILTPNMTVEEKISRIYGYISKHVEYDKEVTGDNAADVLLQRNKDNSDLTLRNNYAHGVFSGFVSHNVVCEGSTSMMKYLLNKIGIQAEQVSVYGVNNGHSILRFKINDGWLYCDPTLEHAEGTSHNYFAMTKEDCLKAYIFIDSENDIVSAQSCVKRAMFSYIEKFHQEGIQSILRNRLSNVRNSANTTEVVETRQGYVAGL